MIDTHQTVKEIQAAGAEERLAEAIVHAISRAEARAVTTDQFERGLKDVRGEIEKLRRDLTIKIYAVGIAVIGVVVSLDLMA